jgi:hypothetical protein
MLQVNEHQLALSRALLICSAGAAFQRSHFFRVVSLWKIRACFASPSNAMLMVRLLLLYRLAVVKRSRVKLAAFFCARLT